MKNDTTCKLTFVFFKNISETSIFFIFCLNMISYVIKFVMKRLRYFRNRTKISINKSLTSVLSPNSATFRDATTKEK